MHSSCIKKNRICIMSQSIITKHWSKKTYKLHIISFRCWYALPPVKFCPKRGLGGSFSLWSRGELCHRGRIHGILIEHPTHTEQSRKMRSHSSIPAQCDNEKWNAAQPNNWSLLLWNTNYHASTMAFHVTKTYECVFVCVCVCKREREMSSLPGGPWP
mgnify:CR=1 FL=1